MNFPKRNFVTPSELFSMISSKASHKIFDIRPMPDFDEYHICGAIHVDFSSIEAKIDQFHSGRPMPIIIVSEKEETSREVLKKLDDTSNIFYLQGGMREGWFNLLKHIRANELK